MMDAKAITVSAPFALDGPNNLRELGGYLAANGSVTARGRVLRSDGLYALSAEDKEKLYEYGVRRIVDLRSRLENEMAPCALLGHRNIEVMYAPLLDNEQAPSEPALPKTLGHM